MRSEEEIRDYIKFLENKYAELEAKMDTDNIEKPGWFRKMSLEMQYNAVKRGTLQWVLGVLPEEKTNGR